MFPDRRTILLSFILAVLVITSFLMAINNTFMSVDDPLMVTANPQVLNGLSLSGLAWAFTDLTAYNWQPLTWISHMLDVELWGLNPSLHHMSGLIIHTLAVILLFWAIKEMTGKAGTGFLLAAVFGIHPLRVESVVWVAERKDVLVGLMWLATVVGYRRYLRRPSLGNYGLVVGAYVSALMAKPTAVTLPFVLLLLDYWPFGRTARCHGPNQERTKTAKRLVMEKIPLLAISVAVSVITVYAQQSGGLIKTVKAYPVWARVANAGIAYTHYLGKFFLPIHLYFPYPHPGLKVSLIKAGFAYLTIVVITALVWRFRRRAPYLLVGWLWYCGTLIPNIGMVQVAEQALADRYTYIPLMGIGTALLFLSKEVSPKARWLNYVWLGAIMLLAAGTWKQVTFWKDDEVFFSRVLAIDPDNEAARNNLGGAYLKLGKYNQAANLFDMVLSKKPLSILPRYNMAMALIGLGNYEEARAHLMMVSGLSPTDTESLAWLGELAVIRGDLDEAGNFFAEALRLHPMHFKALLGMGKIRCALGEHEEAEVYFHNAQRVRPRDAAAQREITAAQKNCRLNPY